MRIAVALITMVLATPWHGAAETMWTRAELRHFSAADDYCFQRVSDTISDLWLAHSNRMAFGRPFSVAAPYPDDEEQTENLPYGFNAVFPARTRSDYLWGAGLWVGGIKGADTLVSHAFDYVAPVPELNPQVCPEGAFQTWSEWADVEHFAVACDTIILGDTLFRCQVGDCNDWYPLGVKVTSHSYTWESPPYHRSVIVEYTIVNIDSTPLEKGWVGIYADCDVGSVAGKHADDISGFIDGAIDGTGKWVDLNIAYTADMNGDPGAWGFNERSTRGAFGVQVLGLSVPGYRVNFNWWVVDQVFGFDWAPRRQDSIIRDLGGSFATAFGDSNKYFVMSYPEIDYNQIEAGLVHRGWLPPSARAADIARGMDTRFLISAGPFNLAPLEAVTFTVAFVAGDHVITNPYADSWLDPSDPMSVSDYYEVFDLDELIASGLAARSVFAAGYHLPPPGPPAVFRMTAYDDTFASFVWSRKYAADMDGYHVMQKIQNGPWQVAAVKGPDDTTVVISGLDPEVIYHFAVASYDTAGAVGAPTPSLVLQPGLPHPPAYLAGSSRHMYPVLDWPPSTDAEVISYRVYRIEGASPDTLRLAELADTTYIDLTAVAGRSYRYFVTAVDLAEKESSPSEEVQLVPMPLTMGILAANCNAGNITSNLIFDMAFVDSLFARGLGGIKHTTRRVDPEHRLTIYELSHYSLAIISAENRTGSLSRELDSLLPIYLANGGKVILILRHAGVDLNPTVAPTIRHFGSHSFVSKYLKIDSCYVGPLTIEPGYRLAGDLIGATPVDPQLPPMRWDSLKVNQFGYVVPDGIPYCGFFWPREPAEVIYRYASAVPDSTTHGQVTGIRYLGDDHSFYVLNFPLSLMELDSAAALLRRAVVDLNEHFICGDVNLDLRFDVGDIVAYIRYLYDEIMPPGMNIAGDVDCSGTFSMEDVLMLINFYLNRGLSPNCCR